MTNSFAKLALLFLIPISLVQSARATELKLLTWNLFMLPKPIKNSFQEIRAQLIPQHLAGSGYDLMFFEEAFDTMARYELITQLRSEYPHHYYLRRDFKPKHLLGSGLFIMSRYPFKVVEKIHFGNCRSYDCYAAKGSVLIEVTLPSGKTVQLASTHLQATHAGGPIRLGQLREIKAMLTRHARAGIPQILLGDFNIDSIAPEFEAGLNIMDMNATQLVGPIQHTSGRQNECFPSPGKEEKWVDHVWLDRHSSVAHAEMNVRDFEFVHKGLTCPLSDHYAVEARISLK